MDKQDIIIGLILITISYFIFYKKTTVILDRFEGFTGHKDDDYNVINFSDDNNEN